MQPNQNDMQQSCDPHKYQNHGSKPKSAHNMDAFLNVNQSITEHKWVLRPADDAYVHRIVQKYQIPQFLARILVARGITPQDDICAFLDPKIKNLMPNPNQMKDMKKAGERLKMAIKNNENIGIIADYDVDGITSAALLNLYLNHYRCTPITLFPDRKKDGYGPNEALLQKLQQRNVSLVITLDCGSKSLQPLKYAQNIGMDVIIIDHHQTEDGQEWRPPVLAFVNPKRPDENTQLSYLAAVGVTFMFLAAVQKYMAGETQYAVPEIMQWLDLVALGTICDLVPLRGLNRAFVRQGLKIMEKRRNIGITKLLDNTKIKKPPDSKTLGFIIGPRINAAGRIDNPDIAFKLLIANSSSEAEIHAEKLETINRQRQNIENIVMIEAEAQYDLLQCQKNQYPEKPHIIILQGEWEGGVIGIIAGRIKEQKNKPTIIIGETNPITGTRTASGRSVSGINLGELIKNAHQKNLIEKGGGHEMAAGFTIKQHKIEALKKFLNQEIKKNITQSQKPTRTVDGILSAAAVTREFLKILKQAGEYGSGNPEPLFVFPNHHIEWVQQIGQTSHLKCMIKGEGKKIEAMAPRALDGKLGGILTALSRDRHVHIAAHPTLDQWNGREFPKLFIRDIAYT